MPSHTLVIVESPSKCKTIEKYLGDGYKCVATFGHLRTIASLKDIDIQNGFTPTYSVISDVYKPKQVEALRAQIANADSVVLACDADREGEAIAYSVCQLFGLCPLTTDRIVFHEITESAIQYAIQHPTRINMNVVYAQQARQILDLLVGFTVTPYLWKAISRTYEFGMSAGRCQTPALRLIYENHLENQQLAAGQTAYSIVGYFTNQNIAFKLEKDIVEEADVLDFLNDSKEHDHVFTRSAPIQKTKKAPTPFTTSTIQQTASNEYNYSPKETMKCCQELYEAGYITYMRTDCTTYSSTFISDATAFISNKYGPTFVSSTIRPSSSELAHEAIRPTSLLTKTVAESVSVKAAKMYTLIWRRTVESCMSDAIVSAITSKITAPVSVYSFVSEKVVFEGWLKVKPAKEASDYDYLMSLKMGVVSQYSRITAEVAFRNCPSHYTEAYLVQLLEKRGIGRPSTFSSIVDKNQERKFVVKQNIEGKKVECREYLLEPNAAVKQVVKNREFGAEKNKLVVQPTGILVIEFLLSHFAKLFEYSYTDTLEHLLDLVASGDADWVSVCTKCNSEIMQMCQSMPSDIKCNVRIDNNHEYIIGKNGPVIKMTTDDGKVSFKPAKKDIDMSVPRTLDEVLEKVTSKKLGFYQEEEITVRSGKFGTYVTWGDNSKSMPALGNRPIENITYADVFQILEKDGVMNPAVSVGYIREVSKNVSIRRGKYGDYIFYKTTKMKTPKFFKLAGFVGDYRNCEKHVLLEWIKTTHSVE
jgi:DNA topoisomerase I